MLRPIREELDFAEDLYESLDEAEIDVTQERVDEARRQEMPFDHFKIFSQPDQKRASDRISTHATGIRLPETSLSPQAKLDPVYPDSLDE